MNIFEKGVFCSGPGRKSILFTSDQGRKMKGGGVRGMYPYCPYMEVSPRPGADHRMGAVMFVSGMNDSVRFV